MPSVFQRLKTSSTGMLGIAVISSTVFILGYKLVWKPRQLKNERLEAEMIANYIFENENK